MTISTLLETPYTDSDENLIPREQAEELVDQLSPGARLVRDRKAKIISDARKKCTNLEIQIRMCQDSLESTGHDIEAREGELARMDALIDEAVEAKRRAEVLRPLVQKAMDEHWAKSKKQREEDGSFELDIMRKQLMELDALTSTLETRLNKIFYNR